MPKRRRSIPDLDRRDRFSFWDRAKGHLGVIAGHILLALILAWQTRSFFESTDSTVSIELISSPARYLRLVQTGTSAEVPWSIAELAVLVDPT